MPRGPVPVGELPAGELRKSDVAELALLHAVVERAERLLDRHRGVGAMHLVEIDPVALQALQARLDRLHDVAAGASLQRARLVHGIAELGRDEDILAAIAEIAAERRLGPAAVAVDVGRVEEGDAGVERFLDDRLRVLHGHAQPEVVAAEAEHGDLDAGISYVALLHCSIVRSDLRSRSGPPGTAPDRSPASALPVDPQSATRSARRRTGRCARGRTRNTRWAASSTDRSPAENPAWPDVFPSIASCRRNARPETCASCAAPALRRAGSSARRRCPRTRTGPRSARPSPSA